MAQRRLKGTRANLADGMKAAKEVRRDLEWTQKRVRFVRLFDSFVATPLPITRFGNPHDFLMMKVS